MYVQYNTAFSSARSCTTRSYYSIAQEFVVQMAHFRQLVTCAFLNALGVASGRQHHLPFAQT